MNDGVPDSTGQTAPNDAQHAWLLKFDIDVKAFKNGGTSGGGGAGATPNATATDLFFDKGKADLTASDKQALDAYADAYLKAKSDAKVTVDGWASEEGNADFNKDLALKRAKAVAAYLTGKGIAKVEPKGHEATDHFDPKNLAQNRRAVLTPPPPAAPSTGTAPNGGGTQVKKPGSDDPTMPTHLTMRGGKKDGDSGTPQPPQPPPGPNNPGGYKPKISDPEGMVSHKQVADAVHDYLTELGQAQGIKGGAVRDTDRVGAAERVLHKGIGGSIHYKAGQEQDYDVQKLTDLVMQTLPDWIPAANYNEFIAMHPREAPKEGTFNEQAHKKYVEERDAFVKKLPEKVQGIAKKAIDAGVEKGIPAAANKLLDALDPPFKDQAEKFIEDWSKKVTGSSDDQSK